jgi:CHASE2 domain-containing sensor protein
MMRSRPVEKMDDRLLVVEITEEDLKWQTDRKMNRQGSLSDQVLSDLLTQLSAYKPTTIGIDVYHDFPIDSRARTLSNQLKSGPHIFMICRHSDPQAKFVGIAPVPNFPNQNLGFSDVVEDLDGVVRRHLFSLTPNLDSPCQTELSLGLQLASHYLSQQQVNVELSRDSQSGDVKFGDRKMPIIQTHWGVYQGLDDAGYQMMINYRSQPMTRRITLKQILNKEFDPKWVQGKIILIGVTAPTVKDLLFTPYSTTRQVDQKMPGVLIQAQMVSQLVSGMLDRRPWIDVLPMWVEGLWVWGWCVGSWVMISRSSLIRSSVLIIVLMSLGLWSMCWISLSFLGILMPFVPLESAMIGTSLFCLVDRYRLKSTVPVCLPPSNL